MKKRVHTWILISSFVITITSPHNIRLQEKLEFGQKTVKVADWSISWKTKIWYEMIRIFYENAAPIYCLGERLISCWRNRRIGVCTQRQGPTSVVLEFTIIAHLYLKKYHNHCVFLKKTFFERSNNIYTILMIVFHEHWVRNHFICVKEAMKNLLNLWTLTIAFDQIESIWDDAEI